MGQQEILNLFQKNKNNLYSTREISQNIGISCPAVFCNLKSLTKMQIINNVKTDKINKYGFLNNARR